MRKIAFSWAEFAENEYLVSCIYEEGDLEDLIHFTKPGAQGRLSITHDRLIVKVRLGILLSPLKRKIENQISQNLDIFCSKN